MRTNLLLLGLAFMFCARANAQTYETNNVSVQTFVGSGFYGHVDGQGAMTMFYNPSSIVVDSTGNFLSQTVPTPGFERSLQPALSQLLSAADNPACRDMGLMFHFRILASTV